MFERPFGSVAGEIGGAEHGLEVVGLPLIDDIEHVLRIEGALAVEDRR